MRYLCPLLLIVLVGCGGAEVKREVRSYQLHGAACEQLGHKATSDSWSECSIKLERARVYRMESIQMETAADPKKTMTCDLKVRPTVCK